MYFLKDASRWKASYYDASVESRIARATKIYSSYIMSSGPFGENISSDDQAEIENQVKSNAEIPLTAFDKWDNAFTEIKKLLHRGALIRFVQKNRAAV